MVDVDDAEVAPTHQFADVGPEVDGDAVGEAAPTIHRYAQAFADRAVHAVGGDQVVGGDDLFGSAGVRADDGHDMVSTLLERDQIGAEQLLRTQFARSPAEDR